MGKSLQRILATPTFKSSQKAKALKKLYDWFIVQGRNKTISHETIAEFLGGLMPDRDITYAMLRDYIRILKLDIERRLGVTVWNISGEGWRVGTKEETAITLVRTARKTIRYADRTMILYGITDRKLIPGATETVFKKRGPKELEDYNAKFQRLFPQRRISG